MTSTMRSFSGKALFSPHLCMPLLLIMLLPGCAARSHPVGQQSQLVVAPPASGASVLVNLAPSFLLQGTQVPYNRIGRVEALQANDQESVGVNADQPIIYAGSRRFSTDNGTYTNLVYRIHFSETPVSLFPFYLGAGKNVGLLVILTLDLWNQPLLVTTVNTCGCYAVSIPTDRLPPALYPDHWPLAHLSVYGERLPARLPSIRPQETLQVWVRADVHRVMDIRVVPREMPRQAPERTAEIVGLESLQALPLGTGRVTSFYYEHWPLTGHVKGAIKPWETLALSLVSMDFFIGMDKDYGATTAGATRFYTSLKPWNRSASDLNDFATYLHFNGWKL